MHKLEVGLFNFKFWHLWIIVLLMYLTSGYMMNAYIMNDSFYYSTFSSTLDQERIMDLIHIQRKFQFTGYLFTPLFLF